MEGWGCEEVARAGLVDITPDSLPRAEENFAKSRFLADLRIFLGAMIRKFKDFGRFAKIPGCHDSQIGGFRTFCEFSTVSRFANRRFPGILRIICTGMVDITPINASRAGNKIRKTAVFGESANIPGCPVPP
ncbi:MAG: hypothetical protein K5840_02750, partial [Eubacterium sp.]|nr:hypothetical protein [Eubacterium sp.]